MLIGGGHYEVYNMIDVSGALIGTASFNKSGAGTAIRVATDNGGYRSSFEPATRHFPISFVAERGPGVSASAQDSGQLSETGPFLSPDHGIELAIHAVGSLLSECSLHLSTTECAGNRPANPAAIPSVVALAHRSRCSRAHTEIGDFCSSRLPATSFNIPAVRF
jgi:hypothetical protein